MKSPILSLLLLLLFLSSCGGSDTCDISCEVKGLGNKGIEVIYADRGVKRLSFHPVDGKVDMKLDLPRPTLIEVFTIDNEPLFTLIGRNGEELSVRLTLGDPSSLSVKGNEPSETYSRIIAQNDSMLRHGSDHEVNALISRVVHASPASQASTLLLINHFRTPGHELQADSLLNIIEPDARPSWLSGSYASLLASQISAMMKNDVPGLTLRAGSDTTMRFFPSRQSFSLLIFTDKRLPDSLIRGLRSLRADNRPTRLAILEISLAADSARWKHDTDVDSSLWQKAWVPGGPSAYPIRSMAVPRLPFYIIADSATHYVYRGSSFYEVDTLLRARLHNNKVKADTARVDSTKTVDAPAPSKPKEESAAPATPVKLTRPASTTRLQPYRK